MPRDPTKSRSWKIEHHWWFLLLAFPFGWLGWIAFGYLGIRLRRRQWLAAGCLYLALVVVGSVLLSMDDPQLTIGALLLFALWVAMFAHGLIIRREAIDRLGIDEDPRLLQARSMFTTRAAAEGIALERPTLALEAGIGQRADAFGGLVDVNHAPADQIALLPGFTQDLAERVVAVREELDGFSSVNDFAHVLDLPPRLVDSIRDRLVCLPR